MLFKLLEIHGNGELQMRVILHMLGRPNHFIIVASCSVKGKEQKPHTWDTLWNWKHMQQQCNPFSVKEVSFSETGRNWEDWELGGGSL